jgi:hypothetical protein
MGGFMVVLGGEFQARTEERLQAYIGEVECTRSKAIEALVDNSLNSRGLSGDNGAVMISCDGEPIRVGDRFSYLAGVGKVVIGQVKELGGVAVILWEGSKDIIPVGDCYNPVTDTKLIRKLGK